MAVIKRCALCRKLLFFSYNKHGNHFFCKGCLPLQLKREAREKEIEEKKRQAQELEAKRRREKNRKQKERLADKRLKRELELEEKKRKEKLRRRREKQKRNQEAKQKEAENVLPIKIKENNKPGTYFSKQEIERCSRLLYVEASVKKLLVIDWRDGKKKVMLNKEREIRRTHAGGFSAEKFQRFVDSKKAKSFEWIASLLDKPGILRRPYDQIRVNCEDEKIKQGILDIINS